MLFGIEIILGSNNSTVDTKRNSTTMEKGIIQPHPILLPWMYVCMYTSCCGIHTQKSVTHQASLISNPTI